MMHFELSVAPVWSRVSDLRESLVLSSRAVGLNEDCAQALGLVASELLENAIKYGAFSGSTDDAIQIVVHVSAGFARVVVTNPVDAASMHPQRLRSVVGRIADSSARDVYVERMAEILDEAPESRVCPTGGHGTEASGLGIIRVAHEAESVVSLRFLSDGNVEVTAALRWVTGAGRELVA